jgi:hypothetical protein
VTPPETESMDVTSVQAPILYGTTVREGQEVLTVYATHLGTMQSASLTIEINVTKFGMYSSIKLFVLTYSI